MTQNDTAARTVTAIGLLGIALIHMLEVPAAFDKAGYLGGLFVASVIGSVVLVAALTLSADMRAWAAAGGLAALVLIFYVLSRTAGLPSATDEIGVWDEPLGLASMVVEGLVVCVTAGALAAGPYTARSKARSASQVGLGRAAPQS